MEDDRRGRRPGRELGRRAALAAAAGSVLLPAGARAQSYPDRPVRVIVPFAPGGGGDILVRLIAQELTERLGRPVVVENRVGAGGNVGTEAAARARPDGYTLLMANVAPMAINVTLYRNLPYDPVTAFTAIAPLAIFPNVLVVPPSLGASSLAELIALGRSRPDGLTYASAGAGSITHLAAEMLAARTGLTMTHVAYRGGGPALAALAGGHVDLYFSSLPAALPFMAQGALRALGMTSARRFVSSPEIPTLAESGLPGFEAVTWIGLVGPAGLPTPIVERLNRELRAILGGEAMQAHMLELGAEASHGSPEAFADYIRAEVGRWSEAVRAANLTPE